MSAQPAELTATATRPSDADVKAVAAAARLAGPTKVETLRISASLARRIEVTVARSGLAGYFEKLLTDAKVPVAVGHRGRGRSRVLTVNAVLVGLLLLAACERPMLVRDVVEVLNNLHPSTKHRLSVPRAEQPGEGKVTERMVSRLYNQLTKLIDPSPDTPHNRDPYIDDREELKAAGLEPAALRGALAVLKTQWETDLAIRHARLRYVLDRGLDATLPDEPHTGSYAVDASEVPSWTTQYRTQPRHPHLRPDPDARWCGKEPAWYGYWLHGVVRLDEVGVEAPSPCFVERIELTAANADIRVAGVELLTRMVADHEIADAAAGRPNQPRRDVLADRAYTSEKRKADDWIWPVFALGFDSVHDLTIHQLGKTGALANGAIVINGQPWSPRTPPEAIAGLANPPQVGADMATIHAYQELVARYAMYSLHAVGGRRDDGSMDFGCRAMALLGQLRCELKPKSLTLDPTERPTTDPSVFAPRVTPKICGQQKSRVEQAELPFWQQDLYGTATWWKSWKRRNRVEGIFGNMKNDAAQDITRGQIRVMGLAKVSLMVLFLAMAANLRLADTNAINEARRVADAADKAAGITKATRTPRRRTQLITEMGAYIARKKAERDVNDAVTNPAAATVDLTRLPLASIDLAPEPPGR